MIWWKNEQKMFFYCFYWLIIEQINKEFYKNRIYLKNMKKSHYIVEIIIKYQIINI